MYRLKGNLVLQSSVQHPASEVEDSSEFKVQSPRSQNTDPRPLTPDPQDTAEAYFLKAIEIARQQQARSLELRATVSLARLWQQQGKLHAARKTLSAIYHWFTEGFETADLQEAKALLDELTYTVRTERTLTQLRITFRYTAASVSP